MATKQTQPKPGYKLTEIGEIPEEWETKTIEQTCKILDSQRVPLNEETRKDMKGNIPYYGANGVLDYINDHIFDDRLILIAEDGGYFEDYQNRPIAYIVEGKCWVNNHAHVLKVRENGFVTDYVFYSLEHRNILPFIKGSTRSKLNQKDLRSIPIPVPLSIEEQQKIAEILSTADEAIHKTDDVIRKTQELKKGLMQRLLTRGIGHTKFKPTGICDIPEEWEVVRLGDICEVVGGGTPSTTAKEYWGGTIPFVIPTDITNLEGNSLEKTENYITELGLKDSSAKLISEGAVLLTSRATIGFCAINKVPVSTNQGFASVICKDIIHNQFLLYYLRLIKNKLLSLASGSTFKEISKASLRKLQLPLPPLPEQQKIAEILSTVDAKIESERHRKQKLQELKQGLMQVLLTGRVRIKLNEPN